MMAAIAIHNLKYKSTGCWAGEKATVIMPSIG